MKRHPALRVFSDDHHAGLVIARRLVKSAAASEAASRRDSLAAFRDAWEREIAIHFDDEEALLAPLLAADDPLVGRLASEHATLRALADEVESRLASDDPDPAWNTRLGETLEAHIRWEERVLFPELERRATAGQLASLEALAPELVRKRGR